MICILVLQQKVKTKKQKKIKEPGFANVRNTKDTKKKNKNIY